MIRNATWTVFVALLSCAILPGVASADVIVADDFLYNQPTKELGVLSGFTQQDYAGGQNGPVGQWTGEWGVSGEATITGPDFAEMENQYMAIVAELGVPVNFNFLQRGYQLNGLSDEQTLYFSVRSRTDIDVINIPRLWINAPLNDETQIAIGYDADGVFAQLGFDFDSSFGDPINDGEFHSFVGKLEINADGDDERLTVWQDPTGPEEGDESVSIEADVITSVNDLDGVLRLGRNDTACCAGKRIYWDDVVMGTTWEDVVQVDVPRLTLQVSDGGSASLVNNSGTDFDLKYYEILSESGALDVDGWSGLGGDWTKNNSNTSQLVESNFAGVTPLADGQSLDLGKPFTAGGTQDLVARVATAEGLFNLAIVEYGAGIAGDYNNNGELDAEDLDLQAVEIAGGQNPPAFDLTGDGLVNEDDRVFWLHDLKSTWVGDADLDGFFDSADFVAVFVEGKYETGEAAAWAEGDWNADLVFDSGDFVAAFIDGGYEIGAFPGAVQAVPEPSAIVLSLLGLFTLAGLRRRGNA